MKNACKHENTDTQAYQFHKPKIGETNENVCIPRVRTDKHVCAHVNANERVPTPKIKKTKCM
jgi:hypothetical protein